MKNPKSKRKTKSNYTYYKVNWNSLIGDICFTAIIVALIIRCT